MNSEPSHSTPAFPVDPLIPDIVSALADNDSLLLTAEPGAGKTTRVPLALLQAEWLAGQQIIMLEPRRLAARNAARYMASQLGEQVGETVGYRIRLENRSSAQTRLLVVTEGVLTRMLQSDPELNGVGLIIFDEFHERHLHSDLALALCHQCQQVWRDDLKLLIMSATLDTDRLGEQLQAPLIHCPGRGFPVELDYRPARSPDERLPQQVARVVDEALNAADGHILVFLPGVADIQRCSDQLQPLLADHIQVLPLHGQLTDQQQKAALADVAAGQRKLLLATNIAESSLTLNGVDCVIDSGLERRLQYHPASSLSQLNTVNISQASAKQRMGRAGRQQPGRCYRLWPESTHHTRAQHIEPEIAQTDLSQLQMELMQWGASSDELLWLTPPPHASLNRAKQLLQSLGLCDGQQQGQQQLTAIGQFAARLGMDVRWAAALAHTASDSRRQTALLAAMMQEWPHKQSRSDDLERRWQWAQQQSLWKQRIEPLAQRWLSSAGKATVQTSEKDTNSDEHDHTLAMLTLLAYPDRLARRRGNHSAGKDSASGQYQLTSGTGVQLQRDSDLMNADWLVAVDVQGEWIRAAIAISQNEIERWLAQFPQQLNRSVVVEWQANGSLLAEQQQRIGQLIWQRQPITNMSAEDWQSAWLDYFSRGRQSRQRLQQLNWTDDCHTLRQRIELVANSSISSPDGEPWPDVSDDGLLANVEGWLLPYLSDCRNEKQLRQLDMLQLLKSTLSWPQQQALETLAPTHWQVPSGSRIRLDYSENPPVLPVKLQEMFGEPTQPAILNGQLQLLIHLLSPGRKPLQVTRDLPHFWQHGYVEVRKEMRGRYPKHPWPEDPLSAEATALTKRALQRQSKGD